MVVGWLVVGGWSCWLVVVGGKGGVCRCVVVHGADGGGWFVGFVVVVLVVGGGGTTVGRPEVAPILRPL